MENNIKYNTRQRRLILDYLSGNPETPMTAETIAAALSGSVGQTTVYRNLERLTAEKLLIKYDLSDGRGAYYQYCTESGHSGHCHLLCTGCGTTAELDCEHIADFSSHVLEKHRFNLDRRRTVLMGLCERCS